MAQVYVRVRVCPTNNKVTMTVQSVNCSPIISGSMIRRCHSDHATLIWPESVTFLCQYQSTHIYE